MNEAGGEMPRHSSVEELDIEPDAKRTRGDYNYDLYTFAAVKVNVEILGRT